ncbi:MAG: Do family serine endopeptidase [Rhodocyclales bacterium]|nr:Do family serine endopeptidase [Rhodocyclales bacterium]
MSQARYGVNWIFALCSLLMALSLTPVAVAAPDLPDFTALVERHGAAVVNVSTTQSLPAQLLRFPGIDENDPMFEWFKRFIPRLPDMPGLGPDREDASLGSGFIISADGYILTNAHVIEAAESILVRLVDKREFHAVVVGADARTDVALIKIEAQGLPVVVMGDPGKLKVGEWVLAIGSPFGFDHSVTAGIVSAKGRALPDENFVPFIQTDVAINPGNSGGPLFNLRGEVVGINSQIYSQTGGFMGLSFAIPIDLAMNVQAQLRANGRVQRGRIGVGIQEVTEALAESFGLARAEGALVSSVEADGPAARAGIEVGDVILRVDGRPIAGSRELPRVVAELRPGRSYVLQISRNGVRRDVSVTMGEWLDDDARSARVGKSRPSVSNKLGLVVKRADDVPGREREAARGLVVVTAQGVAARADLRPGDVLLAIAFDGRQAALESVDEFTRLVEGLKAGQTVSLLVQRESVSYYVSLRVE